MIRKLSHLAILLVSSMVAVAVLALSSTNAQTVAPPAADRVVVRVYYDKIEEISRLANYDLWEFNNKQERYVLVAVDRQDLRELQQMGFRLAVDRALTAEFNRPLKALPGQISGIPGYPCYRTVEETFAAAQNIVASYPNLATWIDVGDSWEKSAGLGGYDMRVLKLTNSAIGGDKPKLFITTSIHARELTPAELATRFAEYLVANYGVDPDVTWLLDYHEIHLMLQANPDGRKHAEAGQYWRKNTNQNYCGPTSSFRGADLNRNFDFRWGGTGSSGSQCDETYRGPSPASEPETQAIQNYMVAIFPDQRPDPLDAPAPADASGIYLDIHSYSQLVLWPWGFTYTPPPNGAQMQTLGRKLAYFNGYEPEQSVGLYPTTGTTDDFAYGKLGVAAYTFELGTAFFQSCSVFENTVLPDNLQALLYAAKAARAPYLLPAGPDALDVTVSPITVTMGNSAVLTATINDTRYNNQNGTEPTQDIAAAEYYLDVPPWDTANGPVAVPMQPADGSFDSKVETVTATVATDSLVPGRHIVFVRGQDAGGNWGPVSAAFLIVQPPPAPDFALEASPASQVVCAPHPARYTVSLTPFLGYTQPVTLTSSGHPSATLATFSINPATPPATSTLTISNTAVAAAGGYTIAIVGTAPTRTHTTTVQLNLFNGLPATVTLTAPADGAIGVSTAPTFTWSALPDADSYTIQVADSINFASPVISTTVSTASYTAATALDSAVVYFWRVRARNACGLGAWSSTARFATQPAPGQCEPGQQPKVLLSQDFEDEAIGWSHTGSNDTWKLWSTRSHSGSFAFHADDVSTISDQRLQSPSVSLPTNEVPLSLQFWNYQELESRSGGGCYDGAILEISNDGGNTWTQLEAELLTDPYDGPISSAYSNPLGGRNAWCGDPQNWLNSVVDLSSYAGQTVQFRFRLGTDASVGREGWTIDDVLVQSCRTPCYDFDTSGVVDIIDVQLVAGQWGRSMVEYDFNYNGLVDVDDIQTVADQWGQGCS